MHGDVRAAPSWSGDTLDRHPAGIWSAETDAASFRFNIFNRRKLHVTFFTIGEVHVDAALPVLRS